MTYDGTKKVKDTKLQMLTTRFKELKMSKDESFDSFYGKLNEVIIGKFNLGENMEDSKIVRKILQSLPESFRAKVTAIEESKDLDEIKIQELIGSLQTYELSLPSQRKSKSLALKTINERVEAQDSSDEDEKDVVYLVKNFRKFLKCKKNGKFVKKGKFPNFGKEKKDFKKKDGKDSQSSQEIRCYKCNGHGHLKKECPNYLRGKGKVYTTTLSETDSSNSDSKENYDGKLTKAYSKIKFLKLEVIQANAKVKRVSSNHQKPFSKQKRIGIHRREQSECKDVQGYEVCES